MAPKKAKAGEEKEKILDSSAEVTESVEKEIESEIILGYKEFNVEEFNKFKDSGTKLIRIYKPTIGQEAELDSFYAKKYAEFLRDGTYMTRREMEVNLINRGIDIDKLTSSIDEIDAKIANVIEKVMAIKSDTSAVKDVKFNEKIKDKIDVLMKERELLKADRSKVWVERENLFVGTIENLTENEKILKKLLLCVKYEDGTQVWKSEEEIRNESDILFVRNITNEAMYYWMGIAPSFFEDLLGEIIGKAE
jgi:hypothetical protein